MNVYNINKITHIYYYKHHKMADTMTQIQINDMNFQNPSQNFDSSFGGSSADFARFQNQNYQNQNNNQNYQNNNQNMVQQQQVNPDIEKAQNFIQLVKSRNITDALFFLIENPNPAYYNIYDADGNTALHWACENGATRIATILASKMDPALCIMQNKFGYTPFFYACKSGMNDFAIDLFKLNPSISTIVGHAGITPLMMAASSGMFDICQAILQFHPDSVCAVSEDGYTPLIYACKRRHEKIAVLFLKTNKTDPDYMANDGMTARCFASDYKLGSVMEVLRGDLNISSIDKLEKGFPWMEEPYNGDAKKWALANSKDDLLKSISNLQNILTEIQSSNSPQLDQQFKEGLEQLATTNKKRKAVNFADISV